MTLRGVITPASLGVMTQTTLPHTIPMAAQDIRPGRLIIEPDGRPREVRDVKYGNETVVLVYTAGPCDVYRRTYELDVVSEHGPCANCTRELADHDRDDLRACKAAHLAHLAGVQ